MPDYSKGKIYCLRSYQTDYVYVGSTIQPLSVRLGSHKRDYKRFSRGLFNNLTSFELIKYDDCYIELIENYPCKDKAELERREGHFIREMDCVNRCIVGRTNKEYREDNKDKIAETHKKYREEHKEQIAERKKKFYETHKDKIAEKGKKYRETHKEEIAEKRKETYTCPCGSTSTKGHKKRHEKTKKHQNYLKV